MFVNSYKNILFLLQKMEMKDNHAFEDKDELGIPRKTDEDNLSVIDLNKYGYI